MHILDWWIKNTQQDDDEYETGCLISGIIIFIVIMIFTGTLIYLE